MDPRLKGSLRHPMLMANPGGPRSMKASLSPNIRPRPSTNSKLRPNTNNSTSRRHNINPSIKGKHLLTKVGTREGTPLREAAFRRGSLSNTSRPHRALHMDRRVTNRRPHALTAYLY